MSTQLDMFADPSEVEAPARPAKHDVITCRDLTHSLKACHRVEDAIWQRLGLETRSPAAEVCAALDAHSAPPPWCSLEAWQRIAQSMRNWATAHGDMQLFWQLRWRRE